MPLIRKRRASQERSDGEGSDPEPTAQRRHNQQRRTEGDARGSPDSVEEHSSSADDDDGATRTPSSTDVMVKKLVRLALASEYSRLPIRRSDIGSKVLGEQGSRPFKAVFEGAQKALRTRFGMEMVELPQKDKVTVSQRRAAQRAEKSSGSSNKSWILCSILPPAYRVPEIIPPAKISSATTESTYTGLYTFIVAVIMLNGGTLPEQKLDRYLRRMNADSYTPIDRTDRLLQRLCKEGYIVRNRDMDGGEEVIEYMVGPRGKMEIGARGVGGLCREVYGRHGSHQTNGGGEDDITDERAAELEIRLQRSLGLTTSLEADLDRSRNGQGNNSGRGSGRGRSRWDADEGTPGEAAAGDEDSDD